MAGDSADGDLIPYSFEKLFRPLPSGVQRLLLSADSRDAGADSGVGSRSNGAGRSPGGSAGGADPGPTDGILLTPEERILEILSGNGGRVKQTTIAAEMDYATSTVSRKLCRMEERDVVTRYRIGREKVVFLPDRVPEIFDSPLGRTGVD